MPGYEPFLLCDFHVHTTWSDGRLSVREVVDLYGQTGRFDVIAITDHILMKRDLLLRVGRMASLGLKHFSVTQDHIRSKKNSHVVALDLREFISADQPAEDILKEIRRQGALSIACHPHHRTTRRIE